MQNVSQMDLQRLVRQGSTMNNRPTEITIPPEAIRAVNELFVQLRVIFPAWRNSLPDEKSYRTAKQIWLETLVNEKITTIEQLQFGIEKAKTLQKAFWPPVADFVAWCKEGEYGLLGLPDEVELYRRIQKFMGYGMEEIHRFKFNSDAEYWLITGLYQRNRAGEWTEQQLREAVRKALSKMAKRIKAGEPIPKPTITLPQRVETPMSTAQIEQKWANIWTILGKRK